MTILRFTNYWPRPFAIQGYTLKFASSVPKGCVVAKDWRPAVITLDVLMPEMDGWVVLSLLKADPELAGIPVIMLTVPSR